MLVFGLSDLRRVLAPQAPLSGRANLGCPAPDRPAREVPLSVDQHQRLYPDDAYQLSPHWQERLAALTPLVSAHASAAEASQCLATDVVAGFREHGIHNLFLPRSLGGEEVDPVTCALITERIAEADTAAAWFVMVANAPRLMAASWPAALVEQLWGTNPDTLIAASGHSLLQGQMQGDSVVVNGKIGFVSGCHHADYISAPAQLTDAAGEPLPGSEARAMVLARSSECAIQDDWDVLGMRGTGSNSVVMENLRVPRSRTAPIAGQLHVANPYYDGALYRCPGRVLFATYVPISLAVAGRALVLLDRLARVKTPAASSSLLRERASAQLKFGKALANFRAARGYFFATLNAAWQRAKMGEPTTDAQRAELYLAGTHGVQASADTVRLVADAAGTSAVDERNELTRLVRDMEVLRHHGFANENRYASVAQQMWGAELDYPLLLR